MFPKMILEKLLNHLFIHNLGMLDANSEGVFLVSLFFVFDKGAVRSPLILTLLTIPKQCLLTIELSLNQVPRALLITRQTYSILNFVAKGKTFSICTE